MPKIIINVADISTPADNDLLVYNEKAKQWECKHLSSVLSTRDKQIKELQRINAELDYKIKTLNHKMDRVLEIIKEVKEND